MMRNGQNKRMRGRNNNNNNNRKSQNPLTRVYESNGPDVKIRGTANHVAEKYIQLARDAATSGDPVGAENYYQHAEHYFRLIAAAQEQFRQANPYYRPDNETRNDDSYEDDDDNGSSMSNEPGYSPREPQQAQQQQQHQPQQHQPRHQNRDRQPYQRNNQYGAGRGPQPSHTVAEDAASGNTASASTASTNSDVALNGLPSFITGGQPQPQQSQPSNGQAANGQAGNGAEGSDAQGDRYPMHRRRRRHRGPRPDGSNPPFAAEDSPPSE